MTLLTVLKKPAQMLKKSVRDPKWVLTNVLWRSLIPFLRYRAQHRLSQLHPGKVTIVTVNWNSSRYLEVLLKLVRARSPESVSILVVDNASHDGTRALFAAHPDIKVIWLPVNLGHDMALDIGFLLVNTEYVVALDVDAFPLHDRWLDELLDPLSSGIQVSGAHLNRQYVHPCCLAMRTARFVERGHSFRSFYRPRSEGRDASGDVGENISEAERGQVRFFDPTEQRGPGDVGTVFGGLVYHNFYSTRFEATTEKILDAYVAQTDAAAAWDEAVERYGI